MPARMGELESVGIAGDRTGRRRGRRSARILWMCVGVVLLATSVLAATIIGTADIDLSGVFRTLAHHAGLDVEPLPRLKDAILWQIRAPRALGAAFIGAGLAVCGVVLQAITRNSLAEPYLLGTSSGAAAGAIIVFLMGFGAGRLTVSGGAFFGALLSLALLMLLLGKRAYTSTRIVLIGVLIGQLFNAIGSLVMMTSGDAHAVYGLTHWLLGELSALRWDNTLLSLLVCTVGVAVCWGYSTHLDAMAFGAESARALGINVQRMQATLLLISAAMVGVVVASVGAIGFVGLIIPHAVRFIIGPAHRWLIPASALAGGIFLVWADTAARTLFSPAAIPVGVFTALIGVPLFLIILKRRGQL